MFDKQTIIFLHLIVSCIYSNALLPSHVLNTFLVFYFPLALRITKKKLNDAAGDQRSSLLENVGAM